MLQWCMVEAVRAMLLLRLRRLLVMLVGLLMRSLVLVRRRRMVLTHDTVASTRVRVSLHQAVMVVVMVVDRCQMMRRGLALTRLHLVAHRLRLVRRLAGVLCEVERVRRTQRRRQVLQRVRQL